MVVGTKIFALIENWITKYTYAAGGWKLLDEKDGILVFENSNRIIMKYGFSTVYSILDKKSVYTHSYFDYFIPLAYLYKSPRVLLIGVGGGTILLQLTELLSDSVHLDAVDVNKDIVDLANKYFLGDTKVDIHIADGAQFVLEKRSAYDIIILDAFSGMKIPKQFFDQVFVDGANAALGDDGILAINMDMYDPNMRQYLEKLSKLFKIYKFRSSLTDSNMIIICSKRLDKTEISSMVNASMPKTDDNKFLFSRYGEL